MVLREFPGLCWPEASPPLDWLQGVTLSSGTSAEGSTYAWWTRTHLLYCCMNAMTHTTPVTTVGGSHSCYGLCQQVALWPWLWETQLSKVFWRKPRRPLKRSLAAALSTICSTGKYCVLMAQRVFELYTNDSTLNCFQIVARPCYRVCQPSESLCWFSVVYFLWMFCLFLVSWGWWRRLMCFCWTTRARSLTFEAWLLRVTIPWKNVLFHVSFFSFGMFPSIVAVPLPVSSVFTTVFFARKKRHGLGNVVTVRVLRFVSNVTKILFSG